MEEHRGGPDSASNGSSLDQDTNIILKDLLRILSEASGIGNRRLDGDYKVNDLMASYLRDAYQREHLIKVNRTRILLFSEK